MSSRKLHLFINFRGMHVESAAEDEGEAKHVVHHVGIVGTPSAHNDVGAAGFGVLESDLRIGIRHGNDDGTGSHRAHHILRDHATNRKSEEHVGVDHSLGERAQLGVLRETIFVRIHACGPALANHSLGVAQRDVLPLHAQTNVVLGSGYGRRACAVDDETDFADVLAHHFQSVQQRSSGNNRGAVLVVVEDWDFHGLFQGLFDVETFRGLDVFQVDAAEGGLEQLADLDNFVGIVAVDFNVEHIHPGEAFEQDSLPFHHGFSSERADVAQTEDCGPIGHYGDQVAAPRVLEGIMRIVMDFHARYRDSGGVSQAQIVLSAARLGRRDFNLSWPRARMVVECLLLGNRHMVLTNVLATDSPRPEFHGLIL